MEDTETKIDTAGIANYIGVTTETVLRHARTRPGFPQPAGRHPYLWPGLETLRALGVREDCIPGAIAAIAARSAVPKPNRERKPRVRTAEQVVRSRPKKRGQHPMASFLRSALRQAKRRATKLSRVIELDYAFLSSMLEQQGGRCAVSGVQFSLEKVGDSMVRPYAPSIDRMDSSIGYTRGNVRLVCHCINLMMNEWGASVFHGFMAKLNGSD